MKITFRGWGREVYKHQREMTPVSMRKGRYFSGKSGTPIDWHSGSRALAKVNRLGLSGNFLLDMEFEPIELRNWLRRYIASDPDAAIRLLSKMQGEAIIFKMNKVEAQNRELQ